MSPESIKAQLQELEWVVSKGFQLRHHRSKRFPPSMIKDAIILIRQFRKLNRS
ncbi:hypothetical protein [Larkinella harenae]